MNSNAEVHDNDLEVTPPPSSVATTTAAGDSIMDMDTATLVRLAEDAPKRVEAYNKMFRAILGIALPGDWMTFGQRGKMYIELGSAGAERLKRPFGIHIPPESIETKKESGDDAAGKWFRYEVRCVAVWHGFRQLGIGFAGSRDKFYGFADEKWKPLEEVRETDIMMAAMRAAQKEAIKQLFGLRRIPAEDAQRLGLPANILRGHTFPTGARETTIPGGAAASHSKPSADVDHQTATGKIKQIKSPPKSKRTFLVLDDDSEYAAFSDNRAVWDEAARLYKAGAVAQVDYTVHPQYGNQILRVTSVPLDQRPRQDGGAQASKSAPSTSAWAELSAALAAASEDDRWVVCGENSDEDLQTWPEEKQRKMAAELRDKAKGRH